MLAGEFKLSKEYLDYWNYWYPAQDDNPPFTDLRLSGYIERRAIHALKLSIITNVSRSGKMILELQDLQRAIMLMQEAEQKMLYVFSGVGKAKLADVLMKVWTYIALNKSVRMSQLMREFHSDADIDDLSSVTRTLEQMKTIRIQWVGTDPILDYTGNKDIEGKYGIGG